MQLTASSIALTQDEDAVEDLQDSFAEEDSIAIDESILIDDIFSSPAELELSAEVTYDSDEVKAANFVSLINHCRSGSELFKGIFTLSNTGTTTEFAITINRVIKNLIQEQRITFDGAGCLTWNKCKKDGRDKVIEKIARACAMLHNICVDRWLLRNPVRFRKEGQMWPDEAGLWGEDDILSGSFSYIIIMQSFNYFVIIGRSIILTPQPCLIRPHLSFLSKSHRIPQQPSIYTDVM